MSKLFKPKWLLLLAGLAALTLLGATAAGLRARLLDAEMRDGLLRQMTGLSRAIDPELAATLTFTKADAGSPAFRQLREQLTDIGRVIPGRGLYTIARHGDRYVFGPETYPAMDPLASAPGSVYQAPPPAVAQVFATGAPQSAGPYADEYGTFVSVLAPVLDASSGQVIMVVALDVLADSWAPTVDAARRAPWLWVGATALLATLGTLLIDRRERGAWAGRRWAWHLDAVVVGALGLALTAGAGLWIHELESRDRRAAFARLADAQAEGVRRTLQMVQRDQVLLATFFESSQVVEEGEFAHFAAPLLRYSPARAICWVPAVPAGAGPAVMPETGTAIRERDEFGQSQAAAARPWYYPVQYREGGDGGEPAPGFDLGTEPAMRAAIEKHRRTGLPSATEPVTASVDPEGPREIITFMPVRGRDPGDGSGPPLRGFVVGMLPWRQVLEQSLAGTPVHREDLRIDLLDLDRPDPQHPLAVASSGTAAVPLAAPAGGDGSQGAQALHPVFLNDRAYGVSAAPTRAFLAHHPLRLGLVVAAAGVLLSLLLAIFVAFLRGRQLETERQVQRRTADLLASNHRLQGMPRQAHEPAAVVADVGSDVVPV